MSGNRIDQVALIELLSEEPGQHQVPVPCNPILQPVHLCTLHTAVLQHRSVPAALLAVEHLERLDPVGLCGRSGMKFDQEHQAVVLHLAQDLLELIGFEYLTAQPVALVGTLPGVTELIADQSVLRHRSR